jgi:hypothetical protein
MSTNSDANGREENGENEENGDGQEREANDGQ